MYQVIEFYQQNLRLARESGQRREEMSALASLARAHDALQEHDKAVEFYELALSIARELGDGRAERDALKHLNPQPQKEKANATTKKAGRSRKASTKTNPRKKSATKPAKRASKKPRSRKFSLPKEFQDVSGKDGLQEIVQGEVAAQPDARSKEQFSIGRQTTTRRNTE